ncbi:MAG: GAF domain-containing protein, partial [Anaerolineales bacterium]
MALLTREQLEDRLMALQRASLELVRDLSLATVLERIVNLAREQANARYAALGVVDEQGNLIEFIPVGMTDEEIRKTGSPPVGLGAIGAIQKERRTLRIANLSEDPVSEGVPKGHPAMESFLGVPIMLGDKLLGQIYLTNKIGYPEFTEADVRVIETLAAYAAVAINNARMYENLLSRDKALVQRNADLALLNDVATALAGTMDVEEVLNLTLERTMDYLNVEAGEIFLRAEEGDNMQLALTKGDSNDAFWTQDHFAMGEGIVGKVAKTGKPLVTQADQYDYRFVHQSIREKGFRCIACIPLLARGAVVGVLGVASFQERDLDQRELS